MGKGGRGGGASIENGVLLARETRRGGGGGRDPHGNMGITGMPDGKEEGGKAQESPR